MANDKQNQNKREWNLFVGTFFALAIAGTAVTLIISVIHLFFPSTADPLGESDFSHLIRVAAIFDIIINLCSIICLLLLFAKNKWGAIGLFTIFVFNAIISVCLGGGGEAVQRGIAQIIVFSLLLCFRKNHRSGWAMLFSKKTGGSTSPVKVENASISTIPETGNTTKKQKESPQMM